jgi:flagellin
MRIQNNVPAINAHRYYSINQSNAQKSIAKLSSGYRINSAADDAAGLAISEKMRAQIRGLSMASKNAQDAISLIQTAEGGMQEIDNMVQRIRELVVYAANDTQEHNAYSTGDRQKIQDEINQLTQEIDSMSDRVEFNKKKVINGEVAGVPAGAAGLLDALKTAKSTLRGAQGTYSASLKAFKDSTTGVQNAKDSVYSILSDPEIGNYIATIAKGDPSATTDDLLDKIAALKTALDNATTYEDIVNGGGGANSIDTALSDLRLAATATTLTGNSGDAIEQAALALETILGNSGTLETAIGDMSSTTGLAGAYDTYENANATLTTDQGAVNAAKAGLAGAQAAYNGAAKTGGLYFQVGANANQGMQLYINSVKTDWLNIGDGNGISTITVLDDTGADFTAELDTLDFALSYVTTERSKLGAAQNRLEYTMNSLDISTENLTAAESRIRDVDMAKEMTNFTKQNILFQASTAMLAQANAFPQGVLQLLG